MSAQPHSTLQIMNIVGVRVGDGGSERKQELGLGLMRSSTEIIEAGDMHVQTARVQADCSWYQQ